ncbi:MAG TPA: intradiol ring-cleavage dioxygenase [Rubrivivax sp.]|nr:intradiol ring-cleavage dioxygenase [Rubrivivax sp.]
MNDSRLSRRWFLHVPLASTVVLAPGANAQGQLQPTPSCTQAAVTRRAFAGPYYRPQSPLKGNFRADATGADIALLGRVVDTQCRPLSNIVVDMWQADSRGEYDNAGFKMRGHQTTDAGGHYRFDTILPGRYPGRTPHFHVMLYRGKERLLTTQLYFPNEPGNASDWMFDSRLVVAFEQNDGARAARFDFVVNT